MEKAGGGKWKKRPKNGRCGMMPHSSGERPAEPPPNAEKTGDPRNAFYAF